MKNDFIPGIYNYCDRWCERCTFTSRCRNFEGTSKLTPEQKDINNKAFWESLSNNFAQAVDLLHKAAEDQGIDLNDLMTKEEEVNYQTKHSFIESSVKAHLLIQLAVKYRKIVHPFIEQYEGYVEKTKDLISELHMGIKSEEEVVHTVATIGDCFAIIQWYLFFIDAKLQRALHGKMDKKEWELEDDFPKDSDGSAKIAIVSINNSINAWVRLLELMPAEEDLSLKVLSLLSKLKQEVIAEFPNAMSFHRPGFDD